MLNSGRSSEDEDEFAKTSRASSTARLWTDDDIEHSFGRGRPVVLIIKNTLTLEKEKRRKETLPVEWWMRLTRLVTVEWEEKMILIGLKCFPKVSRATVGMENGVSMPITSRHTKHPKLPSYNPHASITILETI